MGKGISCDVEGLNEVLATFGAIQDRAGSQEFSDQVSAVADQVVAEARLNAPVFAGDFTPPGHEPGTLRDFGIDKHVITHSVISNRSGRTGIAVTAAYIGFTSRGWYGIFPEFGTVSMSARPFMIPAFERMRGQIVNTIGDGFFNTVMGGFL